MALVITVVVSWASADEVCRQGPGPRTRRGGGAGGCAEGGAAVQPASVDDGLKSPHGSAVGQTNINHHHQRSSGLSDGEILLHPPLPIVGVSIAMERECQHDDSLVNGMKTSGGKLLKLLPLRLSTLISCRASRQVRGD